MAELVYAFDLKSNEATRTGSSPVPATNVMKKIFGGFEITWPKLIIFAIIMGVWTALMAMFVPDGNSFHDIAVTPEWWVLPAIFIIANSKKPLDAGLKTFAFFLISQPLVYLIQVPFNGMGWALFGYYKYWFLITLLTFPGGFIGWFIKDNKWYSGVILSVMTAYLGITAVALIREFSESFPNHLITTIYCLSAILLLIFGILKDKIPRIIAFVITVAAICIYFVMTNVEPFNVVNNTVLKENNIVFISEPSITSHSGEGQGSIEIRKLDDSYIFDISGEKGKEYEFTVSDEVSATEIREYNFEYHYDNNLQTVVVKFVSMNTVTPEEENL